MLTTAIREVKKAVINKKALTKCECFNGKLQIWKFAGDTDPWNQLTINITCQTQIIKTKKTL
jgi:lipopolysaccharide biosynthesis glycosyltransferase